MKKKMSERFKFYHPKAKEILRLRQRLTLQQTARLVGLSKERVRQIEAKTLADLRIYTESKTGDNSGDKVDK